MLEVLVIRTRPPARPLSEIFGAKGVSHDFNGHKLYEVEDTTFAQAGRVGVWTKADSVTHFDDLTVTANRGPRRADFARWGGK